MSETLTPPVSRLAYFGHSSSKQATTLPAGQPFGQSEIDTVYGETLLAEVEGDKKRLRAARKTGRAMLAHNHGVCPTPMCAPPVRLPDGNALREKAEALLAAPARTRGDIGVELARMILTHVPITQRPTSS